MSETRTAIGAPAALGHDHGLAGPKVLRTLVGAQLRRLRVARGVTPRVAAEWIKASPSKITRLEQGRVCVRPRDVVGLLTLYGIDDDAQRTTLLAMAEQAEMPGWWAEYADVVPAWFEPYLGLEQAASVIRSYEVQFIPGLLQTEDYARAVIRLGHPDADETSIERRVALRTKRRRLLHRPPAPKVWAVIDEAALRRPLGGPSTMRGQLEMLIELGELPHVTIEIMPFSTGGHAAAGGPITVLRFPEDEIRDVVYLEQLRGAVYADKPEDVDYYWHIMNRLVIQAEPPAPTTAILHRILRDL